MPILCRNQCSEFSFSFLVLSGKNIDDLILRRRDEIKIDYFCGSNLGAVWGQSNWSQFRGPQGSGIAPDNNPLPVEFDGTKNVIWKTAVSKGNSSPCVWGDRIFLTGISGEELETICIDRQNGKILWKKSY